MLEPVSHYLPSRNAIAALVFLKRGQLKAAVVGSGPNGLAAAVVLAQHGMEVTVFEADKTVGGGMRSHEGLRAGVIHDMCSAVHPLAIASPFFRELKLERHGLDFAFPKLDLAHPLDDGSAGLLYRNLSQTTKRMGKDELLWRATFGPLAKNFNSIASDTLGPVLRVPRSAMWTGLFGFNAVLPASLSALRWREESTRALFAGIAAHAFSRLDTPLSSSVGTLLIAAAHNTGWPVAVGGSQSIVKAFLAELAQLRVTVICGTRIDSLQQINDFDVVMLDTTPQDALRILGARLPKRMQKAYSQFSHGPGAFKVDFLIEGDIPWSSKALRQAGTVHLGGTFAEIAEAEKSIVAGKMPQNPFVLLGQQYLADPSRSDGNLNPVWAYAHVPNGFDADATELIVRQIERFAPNFQDTIVDSVSFSTEEMQRYNANYVGGDIIGGASGARQLIARPILSPDPYYTGVSGVYICSSSTPPGAGVHGMCGKHAAESALKHLHQR